MNAAREALVVVAACALLYLTGTGDIAFYTRGEPREGLVVREMLTSGRWLVPSRPAGEPARKPPLYYWAAAVALRVLPANPERALRLPSAVLGTAAVLGTWATARTLFGPAAGLPAALILASAFEWTRAATSARVDMTLAAALTAMLVGWLFALARGGGGWLVLAAAGATLGTLAKGPVALILPFLAALGAAALARDRALLRRLRPVAVLGVAGVLAGLWYAAAFRQEGSAFLNVVARENWLRFVDTESAGTGHAQPVGYLLVLGLVGLLPWTPLIPLTFGPLRRARATPTVALAAAWVVTILVFFSLASAKRSVYILPLFPAVALLLGGGVAAPPGEGRVARVARSGAALYAPAAFVIAAAALVLTLGVDVTAMLRPWLRPRDAVGAATFVATVQAVAPSVALLALLTIAAGILAARAARARTWRQLVVVVAAVTIAWTAAFDALIHPAIARERSVRAFLARVGDVVPPEAPLYAFFPPDPGLRFYAPRPLRPWPAQGAADGAYLLLWEEQWQRLRDSGGRALRVVALSDGLQVGRGHLALVAAPGGPLRGVAEEPGPPEPPGVRTDSRSR